MKFNLFTKTVICLLLLFNIAYAQEVIVSYDNSTLPVINEELRKDKKDIKKLKDKYIYFIVPEATLTTGTDKTGRIYVDFNGVIDQIDASVNTAPTGANLVMDINKNGNTIWSTQTNRVTILASANTGIQSTFNTTTFVSGDYFTIDIDTVGSTITGSKLTVRMKLKSE